MGKVGTSSAGLAASALRAASNALTSHALTRTTAAELRESVATKRAWFAALQKRKAKEKAPTVILIHEIFGLSDWIKLQVDELTEQGYIVLAPDLVSGLGKNGGTT